MRRATLLLGTTAIATAMLGGCRAGGDRGVKIIPGPGVDDSAMLEPPPSRLKAGRLSDVSTSDESDLISFDDEPARDKGTLADSRGTARRRPPTGKWGSGPRDSRSNVANNPAAGDESSSESASLSDMDEAFAGIENADPQVQALFRRQLEAAKLAAAQQTQAKQNAGPLNAGPLNAGSLNAGPQNVVAQDPLTQHALPRSKPAIESLPSSQSMATLAPPRPSATGSSVSDAVPAVRNAERAVSYPGRSLPLPPAPGGAGAATGTTASASVASNTGRVGDGDDISLGSLSDAASTPSRNELKPPPIEPSVAPPLPAASAGNANPSATASAAPATMPSLPLPSAAPASPSLTDSPLPNGGPSAPVATAGPVASAVPVATVSAAPMSTQALLDQLVDRMKAGGDGVPDASGVSTVMRQRVALMLAGRWNDAAAPIEGFSPSEQQFMQSQLKAIATLLDPSGEPTRLRRWEAAADPLRLSVKQLGAATGKLDLRHVQFCTKVNGFGNVLPFEKQEFTPGQEVILYSEVDNFAAIEVPQGFETEFRGSCEIFDASGVRVREQQLPIDKQTCSNYRRDYFIAYRWYIPNRLEPGKYKIQLTVEDLKGNTVGSSTIDFTIIAPRGTGF
jgi:hypothetical protein